MLEAVEGQQALDGGTGPPSGRLSQCERAGGARQWSRAVSHRSGPGATSDSDPVEEVASERVTRVTRGRHDRGTSSLGQVSLRAQPPTPHHCRAYHPLQTQGQREFSTFKEICCKIVIGTDAETL